MHRNDILLSLICFTKNWAKNEMSLDKNVAETPWRKRESVQKKEARFELCMPKYPYINRIFLEFLGSNFESSSPTSRGANWRFPATVCSSSVGQGVVISPLEVEIIIPFLRLSIFWTIWKRYNGAVFRHQADSLTMGRFHRLDSS